MIEEFEINVNGEMAHVKLDKGFLGNGKDFRCYTVCIISGPAFGVPVAGAAILHPADKLNLSRACKIAFRRCLDQIFPVESADDIDLAVAAGRSDEEIEIRCDIAFAHKEIRSFIWEDFLFHLEDAIRNEQP